MMRHTLLEARLHNVQEYKGKKHKSPNMSEKQQNTYIHDYVRTDMYIIIRFDNVNNITGQKKKWFF